MPQEILRDPLVHPLERAYREIGSLLTQKHYPCVAAMRSYQRDEFAVGLFKNFGSGQSGQELRQALLSFLEEQKSRSSPYYTYWAIFEPESELSEEEFESGLWRELSHLSSELDWPAGSTTDPLNEEFGFCLGGSELFVVGLHARSSRLARRFYAPALAFNAFTQFEQLQALGQYESMVNTIRRRDERFQGHANPMALEHGEKWETIQFSGKRNPRSWKCPFRFLRREKA